MVEEFVRQAVAAYRAYDGHRRSAIDSAERAIRDARKGGDSLTSEFENAAMWGHKAKEKLAQFHQVGWIAKEALDADDYRTFRRAVDETAEQVDAELAK